MTFDLKYYFAQKKELVDKALLERWVPAKNQDPTTLHEAMHYSIFAPGKRIRPILVFASAQALGLSDDDVLPIAAALEMIHVFSLIHDDLPAMDDDDLRRGQPTNHKVYGDAMAILAGDNLLAHAFVPLSELNSKKFAAENIIKVMRHFACATGSLGMIAGQVIDLESAGKEINLARLQKLHAHKTGALIRLAVEAPAILCGVEAKIQQNLTHYGEAIGLAFQIADDILDVVGGAEIGKDIGSDIENKKATYVSLLGLEKAKQETQKALSQAIDFIESFKEEAEPLRQIAKFIVERKS